MPNTEWCQYMHNKFSVYNEITNNKVITIDEATNMYLNINGINLNIQSIVGGIPRKYTELDSHNIIQTLNLETIALYQVPHLNKDDQERSIKKLIKSIVMKLSELDDRLFLCPSNIREINDNKNNNNNNNNNYKMLEIEIFRRICLYEKKNNDYLSDSTRKYTDLETKYNNQNEINKKLLESNEILETELSNQKILFEQLRKEFNTLFLALTS